MNAQEKEILRFGILRTLIKVHTLEKQLAQRKEALIKEAKPWMKNPVDVV